MGPLYRCSPHIFSRSQSRFPKVLHRLVYACDLNLMTACGGSYLYYPHNGMRKVMTRLLSWRSLWQSDSGASAPVCPWLTNALETRPCLESRRMMMLCKQKQSPKEIRGHSHFEKFLSIRWQTSRKISRRQFLCVGGWGGRGGKGKRGDRNVS